MHTGSLVSRLNVLNEQLTTISKLQRMETECKPDCYSKYKKSNAQNNFRKLCYCSYHVLSSKGQHQGYNCNEEYVSSNKYKKVVRCNTETYKPCRICLCKSTRLNKEESDFLVQTDSVTDVLQFGVNTAQSEESNLTVDKGVITNSLEAERKHNEAQTNMDPPASKLHSHDKALSIYIENDVEIIPTKDIISQDEMNKNVAQETKDLRDYSVQNVLVRDAKMLERIRKELSIERKRTKELEEKLKSLTCSLNCLKEDSEQKAACLKDALQTAEERAKLASASRNLAMDLVKQSKDQTDIVKADRDKLLTEIADLRKQVTELALEKTTLIQECDNLKSKLDALTENEAKRCGEVEEQVNRIKNAVKEKEDILNKEKKEFMGIITELSNVIKIQKRRICELGGVCSHQQHTLQEKDKELSQKITELYEAQSSLKSSTCTCKEMKEEIEHLKHSLSNEAEACICLKQEMDNLKENHYSELRIKEKMIDEQNRTITKQKKLLRDSQQMAEQAACEFDQLRNELYCEKKKCASLQTALNELDNLLNNTRLPECKKCTALRFEMEHLGREKQKAVATAKFTLQKLYQSTTEYQKRLACEKQQNRFMALLLKKKGEEIQNLKREMYQSNKKTITRMKSYIM